MIYIASADITKKAIADVMKSLMAQKSLAKISVGEIAETCGINRNSFYYHFKDKYDLVNWIFHTEITQDLGRDDVTIETPLEVIEYVCTFFFKDLSFYKNALYVTGQNSFAEYFIDLLKGLFKARFEGMFLADEDQEFYATFYADAFSITIYRWIIGDAAMPPKKLASLMVKAIVGAANGLMAFSGEDEDLA